VALTDLGCAGCGAPLKTANAEGQAIVCPYCQREHVFEAPPPQPRQHEHPVGSRVVVQWGGRWWAAEVVAVEGRERWRIHYLGWSSSWDEVVGPERIRPANAAPPVQRSSGVRALAILAALVLVGVLAVVAVTRGGAGAPPGGPGGRCGVRGPPRSSRTAGAST
jgi:DNA-directed RNA polymerase subunit RPC12/RpoP